MCSAPDVAAVCVPCYASDIARFLKQTRITVSAISLAFAIRLMGWSATLAAMSPHVGLGDEISGVLTRPGSGREELIDPSRRGTGTW